MVNEDAYNAAKAVSGLYGAFFSAVAQEVGVEKALALHAQISQGIGVMLAAMTKEQLGDKEFDLQSFAAARSRFFQTLGTSPHIEEGPGSIRMGWSQCPFYDGLRSAGLDHKTIELMCNGGAAVEYAELQHAFPQFSGRVQVRSAPDEPCVEEFRMTR